MKPILACVSLVAVLFLLPLLFVHRRVAAQTAARVPALASLELSGPYVYQNLAIFAVHDRSAAQHEDILTLQEGLAQKVVTIEEVGQVNQLVASNKGKTSVYLQSGDIVKGGQQDRVLQHDTLLPPGASKVPLAVFCVESGRWHGRGSEPARHFASSSKTIVTKRQKLAVKLAGNQSDVWDSVAVAQADMGKNLGGSVRAPESATSLQLTLEDKKVDSSVEAYVTNLNKAIPKDEDVVGYAVAVNGQLEGVDVFASPKLFGKMRDKLLAASATEAVATRLAKPAPPVTAEAVRALMTDAEAGKAKAEKETLRTKVTRKESARNVLFETNHPMLPTKAVHKSYLAK